MQALLRDCIEGWDSYKLFGLKKKKKTLQKYDLFQYGDLALY